MLVSNFSLGFNAPFTPMDDRWTSAYELQITNLAAIPIEFGIEARVTYHYFGGSQSGESVIAMLYQFLTREFHKDADGFYCYDQWRIEPNRAIRWHLGPWAYQSRAWTPYVDGYVTLRVPVVAASGSQSNMVPQSSGAVPVLLSTRRQEQWRRQQSGSDLVISSDSTPQLATGTAYNEITPDTSVLLRPIGMVRYVTQVEHIAHMHSTDGNAPGMTSPALQPVAADQVARLHDSNRQSTAAPADERAGMLIELLGNLGADEAEIAALNRMLRDRRAGLVVRRAEDDR